MTNPRKIKTMSCEEFQCLLPDLINREEDPGSHPHVRSCAFCRALVTDLNAIKEEAQRLFEEGRL